MTILYEKRPDVHECVQFLGGDQWSEWSKPRWLERALEMTGGFSICIHDDYASLKNHATAEYNLFKQFDWLVYDPDTENIRIFSPFEFEMRYKKIP